MLAPHYMDAMPEAIRKRTREEDETGERHDGAPEAPALSFSEHRNKRLQCLPLRSSPRSSQQWPHYASVVPLGSTIGASVPRSQFDTFLAHQPPSEDTDMEFADAESGCQHSAWVDAHHNETERLPTPILPSFAAQARGQKAEWAGPGPAALTLNGIHNLGHHQTGLADGECMPCTVAGEADWYALRNNRRLPTPISEVDDSMAGTDEDGQDMAVDSGIGPSRLPSQLRHECSPRHGMEHPNAMLCAGTTPPSSQALDADDDSESPSPSRKGHMRSKHTINTWTWQPGMKRSFSIGYRADCEKCRSKVPGHFNHIVIS